MDDQDKALMYAQDMMNMMDAAMGSHFLWKQCLKHLMTHSKEELNLKMVQSPHLCNLGKLLNNCPDALMQQHQYKKIFDLHVEFHLEASKMFEVVIEERKEDRMASMLKHEKLGEISRQLDHEIAIWKSGQFKGM